MAKYQLLLPKMGESVAEATIIKWLKKPGDYIEADESVMDIATDKVDSEVPSPVAGTLVAQLCKEDDVVQVGSVIAIIETKEAESPQSAPVITPPVAAPAPVIAPPPPVAAPVPVVEAPAPVIETPKETPSQAPTPAPTTFFTPPSVMFSAPKPVVTEVKAPEPTIVTPPVIETPPTAAPALIVQEEAPVPAAAIPGIPLPYLRCRASQSAAGYRYLALWYR